MIAEVPLPNVQKAITSKHLANVGSKSGRRVDEVSVMALALVRAKPSSIALSLGEARRQLAGADMNSTLQVGGGGVLDLPRLLGGARRRLEGLRRGGELIGGPSGRRGAKIKGTEIDLKEVLAQLTTGVDAAEISRVYPQLNEDDVHAIALWSEANPPRGRPPKPEAFKSQIIVLPAPLSRGVRVSAAQIATWAGQRQAQADLPLLIRRLVHASAKLSEANMPGGDSVFTPGVDGVMHAESGSAWVPTGASVWEVSCEDSPTTKANKDYEKRRSTPEGEKAVTTYVAVTARKWSTKSKWLSGKRAEGWAGVRAYDADDLEQWLEQAPGVAIWFGELMGLSGRGIESPGAFWSFWADQCEPKITVEAVFNGREKQREDLLKAIKDHRASGGDRPLTLRADSSEEAAAFAAATLMRQGHADTDAVVTTQEGWRFVEQNPLLRTVIAASTEVAANPPRRPGLTVIIPHAAGDTRQVRSSGDRSEVALDRPDMSALEKALTDLGMDPNDARRLTISAGRSWSVIRRRRSTNPAIREPVWLGGEHTRSLSTICLLGSWNSVQVADQAHVAKLANRPYDEVEEDLMWLAKLDDAPVLQIGGVWKAKSPLELLDLFGDRITPGELDRFSAIAQDLLAAADPVLDLPEEQRYSAGLYGKVLPESELLRRAVCDTLIKLAVRGPDMRLDRLHVADRVEQIVRDLLLGADAVRWLSLHDELPALAEAAPNAFLEAVEISLQKPGAPVTSLLKETSSSAIMSRCWHAGLLWALEVLAWAPNRLMRVTLVLAALTRVEIKGNWANSPRNTLLDLYRSWLPQTAASLEQRIDALKTLVRREPEVASELMDRIARGGHDTATHNSRPLWRDDDAGAGHGVTREEQHRVVMFAADQQIALAEGNPERLIRLIQKIDILDDPRVLRIINLIRSFSLHERSDEEREQLRAALRTRIHWRKNFGDRKEDGFKRLGELERLYAELEPVDLTTRHTWLFSDAWPDLPMRDRDEDIHGRRGKVERLQDSAVREIVAAEGLPGLKRLADRCRSTGLIGATLARGKFDPEVVTDWLVEAVEDLAPTDPMGAIAFGLFHTTEPKGSTYMTAAFRKAREAGWDDGRLTRLLVQGPVRGTTWRLAASAGEKIDAQYWKQCRPDPWFRNDPEFEVALRRLVAARRPQTAIHACHFEIKNVKPDLLFEMLEGLITSPESGVQIANWDLRTLIEVLEAATSIDRLALARLEFALMPALSIDAPNCAGALFSCVTENPAIFTELMSLFYRPKDGPPVDHSEGQRQTAMNAWHVLRECRRLPGSQGDGSIDPERLNAFVEEARSLCDKARIQDCCDSVLGGILAHAPADPDGTWPCLPVRDVLDRYNDMRQGFAVGVFNKRGVTTKSMTEGGLQERALADHFRAHAHKIHNSHVYLAATLEQIAKNYEADARREDDTVRLRMEHL